MDRFISTDINKVATESPAPPACLQEVGMLGMEMFFAIATKLESFTVDNLFVTLLQIFWLVSPSPEDYHNDNGDKHPDISHPFVHELPPLNHSHH